MVLNAGKILVLSFCVNLLCLTAGFAQSPAVTGFRATLKFDDGSVLTFDQNGAKRLDDWVGNTFTMQNYMHRQGPWAVFFRPDADGSRFEVVVELGWIQSDPSVPFVGGAHELTVYRNGERIGSEKVDHHFWFGRYRWQSEPRALVKTIDDIVDHPLLPQLYNTGVDTGIRTPKYSGPMTEPEFERGMPNTGERDDIGVITKWTALALLGKSIKEEHLLALAEDYGAAPVHRRQLDGTLMDLTRPENLRRSNHWNDRGKDIHVAGGGVDKKKYSTFIEVDQAHHPSLFFVPYLLTEDPYWLEELQFVVFSHFLSSSWNRFNNDAGKTLIIVKPQLRGFAWVYRDVVHAHYLTPENAPGWLLPKSHYRRLLDDVKTEIDAVMADKSDTWDGILRTRFHIMWRTGGNNEPSTSIWMQDFNVSTWGLAVRGGYEEFRPWFEWLLEAVLARTGSSGWDRRVPSFYNVDLARFDMRRAANWSEAWPIYLQAYPERFSIPIDKWPRDAYWESHSTPSGYADYVYGALVVAEWLGYDVAQNLDYLEKSRNGRQKSYTKWSFKRPR